ncbi:hypothetical protein PRUPE_1G127000 [Prunus persica]|uniref:BHLH domain-containing protein n=1 Tax=Prunus persica TaxID=3760 RepID=A0A251QZG2_PRUPE|nr:hypothetical protein PRUPE_1G127000 [Prunus persica]
MRTHRITPNSDWVFSFFVLSSPPSHFVSYSASRQPPTTDSKPLSQPARHSHTPLCRRSSLSLSQSLQQIGDPIHSPRPPLHLVWLSVSVSVSQTDKASMLDEIIDYVKFLQLQVKVLSMSRLGGAATVAPLVADVSSEVN